MEPRDYITMPNITCRYTMTKNAAITFRETRRLLLRFVSFTISRFSGSFITIYQSDQLPI